MHLFAEKAAPKRVLCLGAGVNSTALLILRSQGKVEFDLALFADTGSEHPETYDYLENIIKPFCQQHGIELVVIKRDALPLYEYYYEKQIIPSRMLRHCTSKYKIRPIKRYCEERFGESYRLVLGIDAGEPERAKSADAFDYPLINLGIDRKECVNIIMNAGLKVPIKSGCYVCPFTTNKSWLRLLETHPDLYKKAELLEKNCRNYPTFIFRTVPLEKLRRNKESQTSLCKFDGMEQCQFCEVEL